jgi:hypothetical protein
MGDWGERAAHVIMVVHLSLPETITLAERTAAIDAAYPFGERAMHPYKQWLKERRKYLCRYGHQPKGKKYAESPMERMMRRAKSVY